MGQVTIYLDPETEKRLDRAAESAGISRSRWMANLIRERTDEAWPAEVRELAGAWPDFPEVEELRSGLGQDVSRERL